MAGVPEVVGLLYRVDVPGPVGFAARTAVDVAKRADEAVTAARSFLDNLRRRLCPASFIPLSH